MEGGGEWAPHKQGNKTSPPLSIPNMQQSFMVILFEVGGWELNLTGLCFISLSLTVSYVIFKVPNISERVFKFCGE